MQDKACPLRFAVTGAIALIVLYVFCWVGAVIAPTAFSHMFVALFTTTPITSLAALGWGVCNALLFGFLAGGVLAVSYNISAWTARNPV